MDTQNSLSYLLTGFSRVLGKFQLVRVEDQLSDLLNQLNTSLAKLGDHLKLDKTTLKQIRPANNLKSKLKLFLASFH